MKSVVKDLVLFLDFDDRKDRCKLVVHEGYVKKRGSIWDQIGITESSLEDLVNSVIDDAYTVGENLFTKDSGAKLFDWLFPKSQKESLRERFIAYIDQILDQGISLRIWFMLSEGVENSHHHKLLDELGRVSWEGMNIREWEERANRESYLTLNNKITFARCIEEHRLSTQHLVEDDVVRTLVVISNPPPTEVDHLGYIDAPEGATSFRQALKNVFGMRNDFAVPDIVYNLTVSEIEDHIRKTKPHIIMFVGHGYCTDTSIGVEFFSNERGRERVSGWCSVAQKNDEKDIGDVLVGSLEKLPVEERAKLVILLGCNTAAVAPAILNNKIPAVVGMRTEIRHLNTFEKTVTNLLHPILKQGVHLEQGFQEFRAWLARDYENLSEFGEDFTVPVLYSQVSGEALVKDHAVQGRQRYIKTMQDALDAFPQTFGHQQESFASYVPQHISDQEGHHDYRVALKKYERMIVVGPAGRGKSSWMRRIVLDALETLSTDAGAKLPVYLSLNDKRIENGLRPYMREKLDNLTWQWFQNYIEKKNTQLLLVLDGLDSFSSGDRSQISMCQNFIKDILQRYPNAQIVLGCRKGFYDYYKSDLNILLTQESKAFKCLELCPFNEDQVSLLVEKFVGDKNLSGVVLDRMQKLSKEDSQYASLFREPLYLSLFCHWAKENINQELDGADSVIERKNAFLTAVIVALLKQRHVDYGHASHQHLPFLTELVYQKQFLNREIQLDVVEKISQIYYKEKSLPIDARALIEDLVDWDLLTKANGGGVQSYQFSLPVLEGYFATQHLKTSESDIDQAVELGEKKQRFDLIKGRWLFAGVGMVMVFFWLGLSASNDYGSFIPEQLSTLIFNKDRLDFVGEPRVVVFKTDSISGFDRQVRSVPVATQTVDSTLVTDVVLAEDESYVIQYQANHKHFAYLFEKYSLSEWIENTDYITLDKEPKFFKRVTLETVDEKRLWDGGKALEFPMQTSDGIQEKRYTKREKEVHLFVISKVELNQDYNVTMEWLGRVSSGGLRGESKLTRNEIRRNQFNFFLFEVWTQRKN